MLWCLQGQAAAAIMNHGVRDRRLSVLLRIRRDGTRPRDRGGVGPRLWRLLQSLAGQSTPPSRWVSGCRRGALAGLTRPPRSSSLWSGALPRPGSVGPFADEVARRIVIADPQRTRTKAGDVVAFGDTAADGSRVAPHDLRVVTALGTRSTAVVIVVVVGPLAVPEFDGRRGEGRPDVSRRKHGEIFAKGACRVLKDAALGPCLRRVSCWSRPGHQRQGWRRRRLGVRSGGVVGVHQCLFQVAKVFRSVAGWGCRLEPTTAECTADADEQEYQA